MISVDLTKSSEVRKAGDRSNSNVVFSKKKYMHYIFLRVQSFSTSMMAIP